VPGTHAYVDTSAFVKLVLGEGEAPALRTELAQWEGAVASRLLRTEAIRACARYGRTFADLAREALSAVALMPLDDAVLDAAATVEPPELCALDALHLATALSIEDDLGAMLVYDVRLASAAEQAGLRVLSPGA
jgi:predicted nucleic acid-binding protein